MKKLVLPALLALTLAACSSTGPENGAASVTDRGTGVATVTAGSASGSGIAALTDPNNILSKRSVFFDFDSFVIKQEARALIEAHARFLVQNPQMSALPLSVSTRTDMPPSVWAGVWIMVMPGAISVSPVRATI